MTWDNIASLCHYCKVLLVSHILLTKLDPDTHRTLTLHLSLQDSRHQTHPLYSSTASFLYLFSFLPKATWIWFRKFILDMDGTCVSMTAHNPQPPLSFSSRRPYMKTSACTGGCTCERWFITDLSYCKMYSFGSPCKGSCTIETWHQLLVYYARLQPLFLNSLLNNALYLWQVLWVCKQRTVLIQGWECCLVIRFGQRPQRANVL